MTSPSTRAASPLDDAAAVGLLGVHVARRGYADIASFRRVVEDPEHLLRAESHRIAALQDWRLLATTTLS